MTSIFRSRSFWTASILVLFSAFAVRYATSESNGITGYSKSGCYAGGCHHASKSNAATTVTISTAATTIEPGKQYDFRITVKNASEKYGGCDISVDGGTLALAGTGTGLFLSRKELTHNSPRKFVGDSATWNFKWTAPATAGTYHIYAAGNAVNGNGTDDSGDQWNLGSLAITVGATTPTPKIALSIPPATKVQVGSTGTVNVSVKNTGDAALTIDHFALKSGAAFYLSDTAAHSIPAHDSVVITASFAPAKHQQYVDSVIVFSNDGSSPRATVALIGNGTAGVLQATPSSYDFGKVMVGDSKSGRVVLRNVGDGPLTALAMTAQASTQFSVQSIQPFLTLPATLAPNDSVVITILFQPTAVQSNSMQIQLSIQEANAPHDTAFTITGEGVPSGAVVEASRIALRVVPNPVAHELHLAAAEELARYTVLDERGVTVSSGNGINALETSLDVSKLTAGTYWLRIRTVNGTETLTKFVVTH